MLDPLPAACAACRDAFPGLLDGTEDELERRRALAHLAACADCRAALAALQLAAEPPAGGDPEPLDPRMREELLELFRAWRAGRQGD